MSEIKKKNELLNKPETPPPPSDAADTMWKIRADKTREKASKTFLGSIFGTHKEGETTPRSYTGNDFDKALQKGDMILAIHVAEFLIEKARGEGEWWYLEDVYVRLMKTFPEALPTETVCATLFAYGMSRGKLKISENALMQLLRRNPAHEIIRKRLPNFISLCIKAKEIGKTQFWLHRYIKANGDAEAIIALILQYKELDPAGYIEGEENYIDSSRKPAAASQQVLKQPSVATITTTEARPRAQSKKNAGQAVRKSSPIRSYTSLVQDGQFDEAYRVIESVVASPPDGSHPTDHIRLAEGLVRQQRYPEAMKVLTCIPKWYPRQPESPQALYIMAWILNQIYDDKENALKYLSLIIDTYPDSVFAIKASNLKDKIAE